VGISITGYRSARETDQFLREREERTCHFASLHSPLPPRPVVLASLSERLPPTLDDYDNDHDHGSRPTSSLSSQSEWWPAAFQMQLTSNSAAAANYAIP
jgi:hypothetical protein